MKRNSDELLTFIFERIGAIARIDDNDSTLEALADMGRDIVFADRCTIWILDKKEDILWTKVADGIGYTAMDAHSGIVGSALHSGEAIVLNDVYADERFNSSIDEKTGYKTHTMMVIPMRNEDHEVIGAIQVINKKENATFTDVDLKHLMLAATYVGETIKSTLLLEEIDATQRELIHTLALIGENRSKETGNHVKRVAEYSYILADLYGLDAKECELVRDVAPLHDIGKIAIADGILHKPQALNHAEKINMMTHPDLGYDMLKGSQRRLFKAAAIVAHQHHEKYDGSGYPRQLKGEEIHLFGRIVALADVFDALSSDRVYKKAWKYEKVLAYIKEQSGKHFDPKLVELFLSNQNRIVEVKEKFKDIIEEEPDEA